MAYEIKGTITNASALTYSTAAPAKNFKLFGTVSNIALDANNKFCLNTGGTLADYARLTDIDTNIPITATGQIIDNTNLLSWFEKVG